MRGTIGILALSGLFFGCVTPEKPPEQRIQSEGYAVVRVVTNAFTVHALAPRYTYFWLCSTTNDKDCQKLDLVSGAGQPTQVFAGWVAPGTYNIEGMVAVPSENLQVVAIWKAPTTPVQVWFRTLNDLGTFAYQPVSEHAAVIVPVAGGADPRPFVEHQVPTVAAQLLESARTESPTLTVPLEVGRTDSRALNQGLVIDLIQAANEGLESRDLGPHWREPTNQAEWTAMIKHSSVWLRGALHLQSGETAFGTILGQVLLRTPEGKWRTIELGTSSEVLSLVESPAGLVCGTDTGQLYLIDQKAGTARLVLPVTPWVGAILLLSRVTDDRMVLAGRIGDEVTLYELQDVAAPTLRKLGSVTLNPKAMWQVEPAAGFDVVARSGNSVLVAQSSKNLRAYDLQTGAWRDVKPPGTYDMLKGNSSDSLALLVDHSVISRADAITTDGGVTWTHVNVPHNASNVTFAGSHGYEVGLRPGNVSSMRMSADGGASWSEGPEVHLCLSIVVDPVLARAFCGTDMGEIYSSGGPGDWKTEWRNQQ